MARGDGTAVVGYDPENRDDAMHVEYKVATTGDRWFIPYNNYGTTAAQVTQCDKMVGDTDDGTPAGSEM
tara:strand:+ start:290 stop:496 length:207 start_codon:yes stop_codon:yes gene_type:complete